MSDIKRIYPDLTFSQYTFIAVWIMAKVQYLEERDLPAIDQYLAEWFAIIRTKLTQKYENENCSLPNMIRSAADNDVIYERKKGLFSKRMALGAIERMKHDKMLSVVTSDVKDNSRYQLLKLAPNTCAVGQLASWISNKGKLSSL